ncbi:MAG: dipeptidyl-peptidase-4, partial [Luteibaculaceae bacterium]
MVQNRQDLWHFGHSFFSILGSRKQKSMKQFISFLAVILAFFISANGLQAQQTQLSNEVIWASGTFANKSVYGVKSMNNGTEYSRMDQEGTDQFINVYNYTSGKKVKTLAASENLKHNDETIQFASYTFNSNEEIILLTTEEEPIYRHSRKANYFVYTIKSKKLVPLTDFSKGKQSLASFSPDGKHIAFVRNNNLFYKKIGAK